MADDFQQKSDAFVKWFKELPGSTFHDSLKLADLRPSGAGRVATAEIEPGTVLFTIPRTHILTARNGPVAEQLDAFFKSFPKPNEGQSEDEEAGMWLKLVLTLMREYLQGDGSPCKPYLDVLPTSFDTLMFWNSEEVAEMQASAIKDKIGKEDADAMFGGVSLAMQNEKDLFYPKGVEPYKDEQILQLAHLMGSTTMAYAFDLAGKDSDSDDEEEPDEDGWVIDKTSVQELGMVPMADMLNADAEFNAHLQHGADALTMVSLRTIKTGDEVLNYYGAIPNGEMLRRYGYTSSKHTRYDVVEIPWKLVLRAVEEQLGKTELEVMQAVAETGMEPYEIEDSLVLDRDNEPGPDDEGRLQADMTPVVIPMELQHVVKEVVSSFVDGATAKADYCRVLMKVFELRLAQYATTLSEDSALLAAGNLPFRQHSAICVRLGEKMLLREARNIVAARLEKVTSDEPPQKKRKT